MRDGHRGMRTQQQQRHRPSHDGGAAQHQGARTGHCFAAGQRVEVILDRIDRQARRLQFALMPGTEPQANTGVGSLRKAKSEKKKERAAEKKPKAKRKKR